MLDPDDEEESSLETRTVPDIPSVEPPDPESSIDIPDGSDAPRELKRAFWTLVVVFNVGLLALSLGVMLVGFERMYVQGGALAAFGAVVLLYGYWRYRRVRENPTWGDDDADGS